MRNLNREDFKELMAALCMGSTFIYMFCVTFIPVPEASQRFADIILGSLLTIVLGKVLSEYFGNNGKKDSIEKPNE